MFNNLELRIIGNNDKLIELNDYQQQRAKDFNIWLNKSITDNDIQLFYRGTLEDLLKKRIKKISKKGEDNGKMRFLFSFGEKSKSYLKENIKKQIETNDFLDLIQDVSDEAFKKIFIKIRTVLTKKRKEVVINFKNLNPLFKEYFCRNENQNDFINKIGKFNFLDKFKVKNYYIRLLHTIGEMGNYNELSFCVSLSTELKVAEDFSTKDGIILYYWLPKPLERFGTSIEIIHTSSEFILLKGLPIYFSDYYPKQKEFTLTGGLFPHYIIGYRKNNLFVCNPHILNSFQTFDDTFIDNGLEINQENLKQSLEQNSDYGKMLQVFGSVIYRDTKLNG